MSPGAIVLRLRQKFGHGLRVAYWRDVVRPRILRTAPVHEVNDTRAEIHVMTRADDWLDLLWALKSFYRASARRYKLCIHDDGSLRAKQRETLLAHFPGARIVSRPVADAKVFAELEQFPRSLAFRKTNVLAPKVFDFVSFLESDRMLLFDSDLLFFREPTALLACIENPIYRKNIFNADCGHGYTVEPQEVAPHIGHALLPRINSGLGLVHRASILPSWTEEFLALPGLLDGHFWRIEQTLIALCSSRYGAELLPDDYTLHLGRGIGGRPFRHYVGRIRHLMYAEGIPAVLAAGLFPELVKS